MTMKKEPNENPSVVGDELTRATHDKILKQAREIESALYAFSQDAEVLMWACEQLWHHEFSARANNEKLSLFPAAIVRLIVAASAQLHQQSVEFFPTDADRYYGGSDEWFCNVAAEVAKGA